MRSVATVLFLLALTACSHKPVDNEIPIGSIIQIKPPLGLPTVPVPPTNPETMETIALGRRLFYDKHLSRDNTVACASCHNPQTGFTDGLPHSVGVAGKTGTRNAPTVVNAAYMPQLFWDGRSASLEEQSATPIANPLEMDQGHDLLVSNLNSEPTYQAAFHKAFGPGPATLGKVEKAIASFERTLISGDSPFDRYRFGGDKNALTAAAIRGFQVFMNPDQGNCATCHTIAGKYALFTDGEFHNTGAGVNGEGDLMDFGRYEATKNDSDKGSFKTPSLRNIAQSPPYMHDGSLKTLKDVVDFYAGGGNSNLYQDPAMKSIHLTGQQRSDLVAFMESLTGALPADTGPPVTGIIRASR